VTKSELIERIAQKQTQLAYRDVELAVKTVLEHMAERLAGGDRIEIRGFGSFSLHYRPGRVGRNPKTGAPVSLPAKYVPHFKPGKELRERVDDAYAREREVAATAATVGPATEAPGGAAVDPASAD
jgi:integration host factor subunit beta